MGMFNAEETDEIVDRCEHLGGHLMMFVNRVEADIVGPLDMVHMNCMITEVNWLLATYVARACLLTEAATGEKPPEDLQERIANLMAAVHDIDLEQEGNDVD